MDSYSFDQQPGPGPGPNHDLPPGHHHSHSVGNAAVHHAQRSGNWPEYDGVVPQPVVKVLSPRGVEYVFMTIALLTGALSLVVALILLINGNVNFGDVALPTAALLISLPVFTWLFLSLKWAEIRDPKLALDPSKRRSTQFIKIIAFSTCFFTLIDFVYAIFAKAGGNYGGSFGRLFLDVIVILAVAGGILAYYLVD